MNIMKKKYVYIVALVLVVVSLTLTIIGKDSRVLSGFVDVMMILLLVDTYSKERGDKKNDR